MAEELDYQEFHSLLLHATRAAFVSIQQAHPAEKFYGFGLFHEPLWGYIVPVANSEEGLVRRAQEYKRDRHNLGYAAADLDNLAWQLRWNPGDWAYFNEQPRLFEPVNGWLEEHNVYDFYEDDDAKHDELDEKMIGICRSVLVALDQEGIFGTGQRRDQVVLNIMMGDQDRSWFEHARLLNPPAVYERWVSELERSELACKEWWASLGRP